MIFHLENGLHSSLSLKVVIVGSKEGIRFNLRSQPLRHVVAEISKIDHGLGHFNVK